MNRRAFLKLAGYFGMGSVIPASIFFRKTEDKSNQLCFALGRWSRKMNLRIKRVVMIDDYGRLLLDGRKTDQHYATSPSLTVFHLADREAKTYTTLLCGIDERYLAKTRHIWAFIRTEEGTGHRLDIILT